MSISGPQPDNGTGEPRYVSPTIETTRVRRAEAPTGHHQRLAGARSKLTSLGTRRVTRRKFLVRSAAVAGGVALALYVSLSMQTFRAGSVHAAGTPCPTSPTTSDPDQPTPSPCTTTSDNPSPGDTY